MVRIGGRLQNLCGFGGDNAEAQVIGKRTKADDLELVVVDKDSRVEWRSDTSFRSQ